MTNVLIQSRTQFCNDHPEKTVAVQGRIWGVTHAGQTGPALLLLPGTLGRGDIFWQQITALQGKARILALTYPESGGIGAWAGDIKSLCVAHEMEDICVLGSSLGGYIAQFLTATQPDFFTCLIAANTLSDLSILAHFPPYNGDIDAVPDRDLIAGFTATLHDLVKADPTHANLADLLRTEVEGRIPIAQLRTRLKALQQGPEVPPQSLNQNRIFTAQSDNDALIPPMVSEALRQNLDPVKTFVFHNGTHFPYVTRPDEYTRMLTEILEV